MPLTMDARSVEALVEEAAMREGLGPHHDPGPLPNLELLIESCHRTADLTPAGRRVLERVVVRHLRNRFEVQRRLAESPCRPAPPVAVVITGLPRTGTTVLHNLLAHDPGHRVLRLWEALHPVPPEPDSARSEAALVAQAETWLERLYEMAPELRAIHPLTARGPEECDVLLQDSFASQHLEDMFQAEAYSRWLARADLASEYELFARQLALLSGPADPPWALKSPSHLGRLDQVLPRFPDAVVVWCHRPSAEAVASYASLVGAVRRPHRHRPDPVAVGRHALGRCVAAAERALAAREGAEERFLDVGHGEVVADPIGVVARLQDRLGRRLAPDSEADMREWLGSNPRHRHGVHRPRLSDWSLDADGVMEAMRPYEMRFKEYRN